MAMLHRYDLVELQRSADLAREIRTHPGMVDGPIPFKSYRMQEFINELKIQNDLTGLSKENPAGDEARILRFLLRVTSAPLIMAFEEEAQQDIAKAQADGRQIIAPHHLDKPYFDRRITGNGRRHYSGKHFDFMRASSAIRYAAASRVIGRIINGQAPELKPIWHAYSDAEERALSSNEFPRDFTIRTSSARERLLDHVVAANGTILRLLLPAADSGCLDRTEELSWAAFTPDIFFDRNFPVLDSNETPKRSPFLSADERNLARGGIWRFRALQHTPDRVWGFCPANILFPTSSIGSTAAQLCLEFSIPIAREILWTPERGAGR